jgi:hemoglobin
LGDSFKIEFVFINILGAMKRIKQDIITKEDIKLMVDSFYDKVNSDAVLSPVFNDFAKVNWKTHLPKMYNFWNKILFSKGDYKGNPFAKHVALPVEDRHFERWVQLFIENIDELFEGDIAESTKIRAKSIAHIFQSKLTFINKTHN